MEAVEGNASDEGDASYIFLRVTVRILAVADSQRMVDGRMQPKDVFANFCTR
jgi:hypothetical protein